MSISAAPGFYNERKQLLRLLDQATTLSAKLQVHVNGSPVDAELRCFATGLRELLAYQEENR